MKDYQSQSHVRYECKYHIVWCSKYRRKKLYGRLRQRFGEMMHDLCRQKGIELIEGHACSDKVELRSGSRGHETIKARYILSSIWGSRVRVFRFFFL